MKKKVSNKLKVSRNKVKKEWSKFNTKKRSILRRKTLPQDFRKGLIDEAREVAKSNIRVIYAEYQENKFSKDQKSPYEGFTYTKYKETFGNKRIRTKGTIQKFYRASKDYDETNIEQLIPEILQEEGVKGVLVIFKIVDVETDLIGYVSDFVTQSLLDRLQVSLYEHLSMKLKNNKSIQNFEFMNIYIRVIYEKSKISTK